MFRAGDVVTIVPVARVHCMACVALLRCTTACTGYRSPSWVTTDRVLLSSLLWQHQVDQHCCSASMFPVGVPTAAAFSTGVIVFLVCMSHTGTVPCTATALLQCCTLWHHLSKKVCHPSCWHHRYVLVMMHVILLASVAHSWFISCTA